jgi:superfamily II DNA/RNA helicase
VLRGLLRSEQVKNALIFCNRKRDVDVLYRSLQRHGFNVGALHGDMDQGSRTETLESFKRGDIALLVCSDVAARGIDIDDMSHVFNFDVPIHAEDYVHRIGRTGRAGRQGRSLTLAAPEDGKHLAAIERLLGKRIERLESTAAASPAPQTEAPHERGRERGPGEEPRRERRERRPRRDARHDEQRAEAPGGQEPRRDDQRRDDRRPERRPEQRPERRQEQHGAPRPAAAPITQGTPENRPQPVPLRPQAPQPQRRREHDDERVVGMGDHVPAFLKRGWRAVG